MGIFDKLKRQVQHRAKSMSDTAERKTNERTGNRYGSQIDDAQQNIEGRFGTHRDRRPDDEP
ncbi:antitoxin [Streptomyces sp. NPDC046831]|uniref:antitoxin n=1 Tax=Streptomyces sp. NPDC046831 TaxID=3154805 RepID=UPI0033E81189